ncbi:MAG: nucleotidyl transferase AbiEii/AbiGii toxin family protein [Bdellovibrionales bacterium]|nr:nucleotidyl transferase AbiEii/AbiGii toxin family protein [Bdellovibrionales bacterium]
MASNKLAIPESLVEKDYWVTCMLKNLVKFNKGKFVFKGGTSLSKAYKVIERFSEDIDISLIEIGSLNRNRKISKEIEEKIKKNLPLVEDQKESRKTKDSRRRRIPYRYKTYISSNDSTLSSNTVILETSSFYKIPVKQIREKEIGYYIAEGLLEFQNSDLISRYKLHSFKIPVQSLELTFSEKLICLYKFSRKKEDIRNKDRHFYDISQLYKQNSIQEYLKGGFLKDLTMLYEQEEGGGNKFDKKDFCTHLENIPQPTKKSNNFKSLLFNSEKFDFKDIEHSINGISKILNTTSC